MNFVKNENSAKNIRGQNNGTFGFGMFGGLFPKSMNGPFGSMNYPLPQVSNLKVSQSPYYNSKYFNGPDYNQQSFSEISGYTFDTKGTAKKINQVPNKNYSGINDDTSVLIIKPH